MKTIQIKCEGAENLNLDQLAYLQGNLKSLSNANYERFKNEIIKTGYTFPIKIWKENPGTPDQVNWIVGGHQSYRVLKRMRDLEGFQIPSLPVSITFADDIQQARQRVLQDISTFGKVDRQGLYEFTEASNLTIDEIEERFDVPNIDMESFKFEFYQTPQEEEFEGSDSGEPKPPGQSNATSDSEGRREDLNPLQKDRETYLNNNIKQIVLFYEGVLFEDIIGKANKLLDKYELEDFSALFLKLVNKDSI